MAIQQAAVTITGFVAGDPVLGGTDAFPVLTFRMGSTRSRLNQSTQQWEDFATAWITVKAFRALAKNTMQSIRRGDRIIVVGVLNTDQWTTEQGEPRSKTVVEATNIGHDLTFGTTSLAKAQRNGGNTGGVNNDGSGEAPQQGASGQRPQSDNQSRGVDPYANSTGKGPVEFGTSEGQVSGQSQDEDAANAGNVAPPETETNQTESAEQQSFTEGFADTPERDESEF